MLVAGQESHLARKHCVCPAPIVRLLSSSPLPTQSRKGSASGFVAKLPIQCERALLPAELTQKMPLASASSAACSAVPGPPLPSPRVVAGSPSERLMTSAPWALAKLTPACASEPVSVQASDS